MSHAFIPNLILEDKLAYKHQENPSWFPLNLLYVTYTFCLHSGGHPTFHSATSAIPRLFSAHVHSLKPTYAILSFHTYPQDIPLL